MSHSVKWSCEYQWNRASACPKAAPATWGHVCQGSGLAPPQGDKEAAWHTGSPPHLCLRAGYPPPGPGGVRASRETGQWLDRCQSWDWAQPAALPTPCCSPIAVTLCTSFPGTSAAWPGQGLARRLCHEGRGLGTAQACPALSTQSLGRCQLLFPPPGQALGGEVMAQLPRASRQLSFWDFQGTGVGLWSDRYGLGAHPGVTLTS